MSEIKVNSIKGVGASTAAITVNNTDGTCTANITSINGGSIGTRNLIINGAMQVAQRATSSTSTNYQTVDRFALFTQSVDEAPTQAQVDVASGTTPYTSGFRKSFKITNGNQTSGAGATDFILTRYKVEDQDLATSGWNYLSSSSNITLSFWVKSSVAQNFYFDLQSDNGSVYNYVMETGSLTADTWTKITKTIPGNTNIVLNNDNGAGLFITWRMFDGTDRTGTRPLNAWAARDAASQTPDATSTWYTTNDATFEMTGVQLEVGSVATDFEFRSFGQELALAQRYFEVGGTYHSSDTASGAIGRTNIQFANAKRADPTVTITISAGQTGAMEFTGTSGFCYRSSGSSVGDSTTFTFTADSEL